MTTERPEVATAPIDPTLRPRRTQEEFVPAVDVVELGVQEAEDTLEAAKKAKPGADETLVKTEVQRTYTEKIGGKVRRKAGESKEVRDSYEKFDGVNDDLKPTSQNILRVMAEFIRAAQLGIVRKPGDPQSRAVFDSLVQQADGKLTKKTAAFLIPLVQGLLEQPEYVRFSPDGAAPTQFEQDLLMMMTGQDEEVTRLLQEILSNPIAQGRIQNMTAARFQPFFEGLKKNKREEIEKKRQEFITQRKRESADGSSYAHQEMTRVFYDERDREKKSAWELYEAIRTTDAETFVAYYRRLMDSIKSADGNLSDEDAGKRATEHIQKTLLYITNTMFQTVLSQAPDKEFSAACQAQQIGFGNPQTFYNEAIIGNLRRLLDSAKKIEHQEGHWYVFDQAEKKIYNPDRQRFEIHTSPTAKLAESTLTKHISDLGEIAQMELGALTYQFNLRFLIDNPGKAKEGGIFGAMAGYARDNLKTETIDHLYILPYNELIQAAIMSLEPHYKRLFAQFDWRKDPKLQSALFEQLKPAETDALAQLRDSYKHRGEDVPQWAIERAFNHARLMSFGKEFFFQALSSYADPFLTDTGDQTYLGEGPFAGNSVYDVFEAAKRWGSADPIIVNLPYMPQNATIKDFRPEELVKKGKKYWQDSFTNGQLAYYDDEVFRDHNPLIAITNMTKMGGVDTYGGWRVKYAYAHWLGELYDNKSNNLDISKGPDVLVHGWKAIENIGTNVLKNYAESFIFNGDVANNERQFELFFKFLYRRYFNEGLGRALCADVGSDAAFWQKIKGELDNIGKKSGASQEAVLKKYVYDALTVALYERMPTEFVFMERRRASQNGVTLLSELQEEFIGSKDVEDNQGNTIRRTGKWTDGCRTDAEFDERIRGRWDVAVNDIIYVQQVARVDSIQKMKELEHQHGERLGVLWGDLSQDRSEVDYRITPEKIQRILRQRYAEDPDRDNKVQRAVDLYNSMTRKVMSKPKDGQLETKWRTQDRRKYQDVRQNVIRTRAQWFSNTWKDNNLGGQITTAEAGQFLNRSATGEELVARTAEASMVISQSTKDFVAGGKLLEGISSAVRTGEEGWKDLYEGVSEVYKSAKGEDQDVAKGIVRELVNWQLLAMRKDSRYRGQMGALNARIAGVKTSLAANKVDMAGIAYDFDDHDMAQYVQMYTAKNIIRGHTKKGQEQYVEVPPTFIDKVVAKLTGKEAQGKLVRDYSRELSGEAVLHMHKASRFELMRKNLMPVLGLMALAIIYIFVKKALEESEGG